MADNGRFGQQYIQLILSL